MQTTAVCGSAAVLVASVAPSAGAAAHGQRPPRPDRKHHRRHLATEAAKQARGKAQHGCRGADASASSASLETMRAAVVCLINQERGRHGLPSLRVSWRLNRSAQSWNKAMVSSGNFTHGSNFASRISAVGYDWQTAGENIATGYQTPRQVVGAWMASPDHCRNILDPSFRDVGTGETAAAVGSWASGPATWTQDFGLLMSGSAPSANTGPQNGCPY